MTFSDFLLCPLCAGRLTREGGSLFCDAHTGRRHCYDIASAGYVNLLPPGKGGNAHTGDDGAMIAARTAFLSGGYYDGISDAAAQAAAMWMPAGRNIIRFLDAGSGEGYHTCRMARGLHERLGFPVDGCGVDASRKGAAAGARLARSLPENVNVSFVCGNIFSLPAAEGSLDVLFSLFAPIPAAQAMRTLRDDGILVVVAAAPRHLWELRCLLYDEPREGNAEAATPQGFVLREKRSVSYTVSIPDNRTLSALFTMTPFYYRTPESGRARLAAADSLNVTAAADIYVFQKKPEEAHA